MEDPTRQYSYQVMTTDAASWEAVDRKTRLAGNGLRPRQAAQHRGRPLPGSFEGTAKRRMEPQPPNEKIRRSESARTI